MREDIPRALSQLALTRDGATARFCFPPELPIFAGHFPGAPIVPGIYLVEGARLLGERAAGGSLIIAAVEVAKFSATVHPGDSVEASVVLDVDADEIVCQARFRCKGVDAARIRLRLRRSDGPPNKKESSSACNGS